MIFAWIAAVIYGVNGVVGKLTSKHAVTNPWLFNFFWGAVSAMGTTVIALANHAGMPIAWGSLLIASIFSCMTGILYIFAMYKLDVSVLGPLYNVRVVFTAILGAIFLGEILTGHQYILIAVIFISGIFLTLDEHRRLRSFFRKEVMIGLAAIFSSALMASSIKWAVLENGYWTFSLWMPIIAQGILLGTIPLFWKDLFVTPLKKYSGIILVGLLTALGELAATKAFSINVSIASAIISIPFSMIIAYLFSIFAPTLLEKHTHRVYVIRFAAAAVMLIAAIKLS